MILLAIELTSVGPFRETVRLGPFAPGLNLVCAPNEAGKSTTIRAAARALFDRHTTKSDEIKAFQPAGTDLAPRVVVEFETLAGRFRIEKNFLQSPRSLLKQWLSGAWQPVAEADAADQRVQALLNSTLPGKGATKPEHWGFLGFLWARQGELALWPGLDDAAVGQRLRARLARVELDPVIEKLRNRLGAAADSFFTSKGLPKINGPLDLAEKELAAIELDLAALRKTRADLESVQQRYAQAHAAVAQLEQENTERERVATAARELALAAERLRGELDTRQLGLLTAQDKLTAIVADVDALAKRQQDVAHAQAALAQSETAATAAEHRLTEIRRALAGEQAARPDLERQFHTLRAEHQRVQSLLKLRQLSAAATTLSRQISKAETTAAEITALETKRAQLPTLTLVKLRKLEELAESMRTLGAHLQALGLTVELTPDHDSSASVQDGSADARETLPAGQTTRLYRPQSLDLQLAGWGRISIRSGAHEAQNVAAQLRENEYALRLALQEAGVASVEAAREAVATRKELDAHLKAMATTLSSHLGEHATLAALRESAASANHRMATLTAAMGATGDEQARSVTDLETAESQLAEAVPAAEKTLKLHDQKIERLRIEERDATQAVQAAVQVASDHRARLRTLQTQIADLAGRYAGGIDAAKTAAQLGFVQAEARVAATKAELPRDFEKLPERNKRAAAALQQLASELQVRRAERDQAKGTLETLGGQGLYSRETELEEKKVEATLRRDAARAQGWATRIAHDLIEHRKQAATKAVLTPLEQRLTAAFSELSGDSSREVFLDEHLQIAGLGRTRESAYAFESLSQGAKEQLLLCLRIAVAQELATDEPQVLILDDVLVNTDRSRQERVLDVLGALSAKLQIIILTCHAERYRGAGTALAIVPAAAAGTG